MRNKFVLVVSIIILLTLAACGNISNNSVSQKEPIKSSDTSQIETTPDSELTPTVMPTTSENNEIPNIHMTIDSNTYIVELYDNPASRELVKMLPLTLTFTDFAGSEKIAYLPNDLQISDTQEKYEAVKGDLTIYLPMGNLAFFYKDYHYSSSLYKIGHIEDINALANMSNDFTAVLEAAD